MAAPKPSLHGRDHRAGGADPIPDLTFEGIQFDTLNGNSTPPTHWFSLTTTNPAPPASLPGLYLHDSGGAGMKLLAGSGGNLEATSSAGLLILSGASGVAISAAGGGVGISADTLLNVIAGADATFSVTGDTTMTSHGGITLTAGTSGLTSPNGVLDLQGYDAVNLFCSIGDIGIDVSNAGSPGDHCLRVTSNAASPTEIFRVDSDGTIHGQASVGAIVWDIV